MVNAPDTIPLTRMQAAAIHSAIDGRLEATDAISEPDVLGDQGRELLVIASALECIQQRRFPVDEDARVLLATLHAEAEDDVEGEWGDEDEDNLLMLRATA